MAQKPKTPPKPAKAGAPKPDAFDVWLERGLHELFDEVANEPVPEELLKLIDEDKRK